MTVRVRKWQQIGSMKELMAEDLEGAIENRVWWMLRKLR
jgi:hypothetical protein